MTRIEVLLQRRKFLVDQYETLQYNVLRTHNQVDKLQMTQEISILFQSITEVDNFLLKESS